MQPEHQPTSVSRRGGGATLWTMRLDRRSPVSLSRQLAAALRRAISEGSLAAGARLPSSRALAAELGLARSTIVGVFEQLIAEGYVASRPGSGCYVPVRAKNAAAAPVDVRSGAASRKLSRQAALLQSAAPHTQGRVS
jgi:GntR family transcriptional regulator / MocR family aminotransferase